MSLGLLKIEVDVVFPTCVVVVADEDSQLVAAILLLASSVSLEGGLARFR